MKSYNNNVKEEFKQCACRGCKKPGVTKLRITLLRIDGWFCDSCALDLMFDGIAEDAATDREIDSGNSNRMEFSN